jgi:hypothetical protein
VDFDYLPTAIQHGEGIPAGARGEASRDIELRSAHDYEQASS